MNFRYDQVWRIFIIACLNRMAGVCYDNSRSDFFRSYVESESKFIVRNTSSWRRLSRTWFKLYLSLKEWRFVIGKVRKPPFSLWWKGVDSCNRRGCKTKITRSAPGTYSWKLVFSRFSFILSDWHKEDLNEKFSRDTIIMFFIYIIHLFVWHKNGAFRQIWCRTLFPTRYFTRAFTLFLYFRLQNK